MEIGFWLYFFEKRGKFEFFFILSGLAVRVRGLLTRFFCNLLVFFKKKVHNRTDIIVYFLCQLSYVSTVSRRVIMIYVQSTLEAHFMRDNGRWFRNIIGVKRWMVLQERLLSVCAEVSRITVNSVFHFHKSANSAQLLDNRGCVRNPVVMELSPALWFLA